MQQKQSFRPQRLQPTHAKATYRERQATRILASVSIVVGIFVAIQIWQQSPVAHSASHGIGQESRHRTLVSGVGFSRMKEVPPTGFGDPSRALRAPRYLANLTSRIGPYVVSVRQVFGSDPSQNLLGNHLSTPFSSTSSHIMLSLQILAENPRAIERLRDSALHLTAVDDTGHRLVAMTEMKPFGFANGQMRQVTLSAPAANAKYLKTLEGELRLGAPDQTLPFHIQNVPLPVSMHIFGVAAAAFLSDVPTAASAATAASPQSRLSHGAGDAIDEGITLLTGRRADANRRAFPPFTPELGPLHLPNRLTLQPDVTNRFEVPLPESAASVLAASAPTSQTASAPGPNRYNALQCRVTPQVGQDGEIATQVEVSLVGAAPLHLHVTLWDNEPVVLLLPIDRLLSNANRPNANRGANSGKTALERKHPDGAPRAAAHSSGGSVGLWLHLYMDMPPPERDAPIQTVYPFRLQPGQRGGSIEGQLLVGEEPIALGWARVEISQIYPTGEVATSTKADVVLDKEGRCRFGNLSPGRYRLRLLEARPSPSLTSVSNNWSDYLRHRYHLIHPLWQNEVQEAVTVRPGGAVLLPPWRVVENVLAKR